MGTDVFLLDLLHVQLYIIMLHAGCGGVQEKGAAAGKAIPTACLVLYGAHFKNYLYYGRYWLLFGRKNRYWLLFIVCVKTVNVIVGCHNMQTPWFQQIPLTLVG